MIVDELNKQVVVAAGSDYKMVLVVGAPGSGKSKILRDYPKSKYININKELSKKLQHKAPETHHLEVKNALQEIIDTYQDAIIVFDNIGILFRKIMKIDPLDIILKLNTTKVLIVSWVGNYDGTTLSWAEPGRPDYRVYEKDKITFPVVTI